jgi:hypothetical protein
MGDVAEQPIGNAKATFSSDATSQGQQSTRAAKRRGFYCCWPSIARSAKFLQTTEKQFRNAQTNCNNRIT